MSRIYLCFIPLALILILLCSCEQTHASLTEHTSLLSESSSTESTDTHESSVPEETSSEMFESREYILYSGVYIDNPTLEGYPLPSEPEVWNGYPVLSYDYEYAENRYPYGWDHEVLSREDYFSKERYIGPAKWHIWESESALECGAYKCRPFFDGDGNLMFYRLYSFRPQDDAPAYRLVSEEDVQRKFARDDGILLLTTWQGRLWKMGLMGENPVLLSDLGHTEAILNACIDGDDCVYYVSNTENAIVQVYVYDDVPVPEERIAFQCENKNLRIASGFIPLTNYAVYFWLYPSEEASLRNGANTYYGPFVFNSQTGQLYKWDFEQVPEGVYEDMAYGWFNLAPALYPLDPAERAECPWLVPIDEIPLP